MLGRILPSSPAVEAYIRVQTMGATFDEVAPQIANLWQLVFIYGGLSIIGMHLVLNKEYANRTKARLQKGKDKLGKLGKSLKIQKPKAKRAQ